MCTDCTLCTWSVDDVAHTEELTGWKSYNLSVCNFSMSLPMSTCVGSLYTTDADSQMLVALGKDNGNGGDVEVMGGNWGGTGMQRQG